MGADVHGCLDEERIVAFCRGEHDGEDQVETHLGECSDCMELVSVLLGAPAQSARQQTSERGTPPLPSGTRIARFELLHMVGQGGMGDVYAANDPQLMRQVALKVVRRELRQGAGAEEANRRLQAEARLMAQLQHPNVVTVYEIGTSGEELYIAMEWVRGVNLAQWLAEQKRGWREIVQRFLEAGRGLAAAHRAGILHRDFKPANVLISGSGEARVADFGLAGWAEGEATAAGSLLRKGGGSGLRGTLAYLAPERLLGARATPQSDQFSFCVALKEALTGEHPFARSATAAPNAPRPRLPTGMGALLERGLSAHPDQRFERMDDLLKSLEEVLRRGPRRRRVAMSLVTTSAALVLALGAHHGYQRARCAAAASLDQTWGVAERTALGQRFAGMSQPLGAELWERLQARIDAYAQLWSTERASTCRTPTSSDAQHVRLQEACYESRRVGLKALVDALAGAPDLELSMTGVYALPRIETCRDLGLLQAELELPDEPERAVTAEALRHQLAKGQGLYFAGRFDEAARALDEALVTADTAGLKSLQGAVRLWRGEVERELGRLEKAAALYHQAILLAAERRDPMLGTRSYASLAFTQYALARHEDAHASLEHARALLRGVGHSPELEADLLATEGRLLLQERKRAEAMKAQLRALQLREEHLGADHISIPQSLGLIGELHARGGSPAEAVSYFERALALHERQLGKHHSFYASSLSNLALARAALGGDKEALPLLEEALRIVEARGGPPTLDVAKYALNLGNRYSMLEQPERAISYFEKALQVFTQHLDAGHPILSLARTNLGLAWSMHGEPQNAEVHLREALQRIEKSYGPDDPETLLAEHNLAGVLREQGRTDEARQRTRRIVQKLPSVKDLPPSWAAEILHGWGRLLADQRRWREAVAAYREAFGRVAGEENSAERVPVLTDLAGALEALGHLEEAQTSAEQAISEEAALRDRPRTRARAELALARIRWRRGDRKEARAIAAEAHRRISAAGDAEATEAIALDRWLKTRDRSG